MDQKIKTPCIGVCSTGIGDSVCRGCKRFCHEVIGWNGYSEVERSAILERLDQLLTQVVRERLFIVDPNILRQQLQVHQIRIGAHRDPYAQAYEAVRRFGNQLPSLEAIGCRLHFRWSHLSLAELKRSIDEDLYRLSCAHYQRYFPETV